MNSGAEFGRRSGPAKPSPIKPSTPDAADGNRSDPVRKRSLFVWLVLLPIGFMLVFGTAAAFLPTGSTSSGSSGFGCRSKPAGARGVFDIDWCQAAAAGLQGAARGVAGGAGARSAGR